MSVPIIGIAINEIHDAGKKLHHLPISYTPSGYVKAIQSVGGIAFLLPISNPETAEMYVSKIDKLILTGGQNISPQLYDEQPQFDPTLIDYARDEFELALINAAVRQQKPIFGVCRGMQLMNVAFGGSLYQDISITEKNPIHHMQAPIAKEVPTHLITTEEGSVLRKIYGKKTKVNSFHYQAIHNLSPNFKVTAYSEDGVIEGIESIDKQMRILGVQWHPDFAYTVWPNEQDIFEFVVKEL